MKLPKKQDINLLSILVRSSISVQVAGHYLFVRKNHPFKSERKLLWSTVILVYSKAFQTFFIYIYNPVCFLSVIILIGSVCLLFFQTRQTAENQLSLAAESITSYQKELRDKTYLLTASHELAEMIKNYQQYSTDENYEKSQSLSFKFSDRWFHAAFHQYKIHWQHCFSLIELQQYTYSGISGKAASLSEFVHT